MADTELESGWCDRLAESLVGAGALGPDALTPQLHGRVLRIARDVAHGSERRNAPVAAFLAGRYVEARRAAGVDAETALSEVAEAVARLLRATTTPDPQGD
jgi:hypothetical protein